MIEYLTTNWIEIAGTIISVIYLYLSIREKPTLWIFGFISSLLYIWVFFHNKLYAEISLQIYYLVISIYGWIHWQQKNTDATSTDSPKLATTRITKFKEYLQYSVGLIFVFVVYYIFLTQFTDSNVPIYDSAIGAMSIIATWMLAKKKIENWLVWIVADFAAAILYCYKGLYPTTILFIIYTIMAIVGYFQWKKNMSQQSI